jgi:hypothetical protein
MGAHQVAKKPRRRKSPAGQFNLRQSSCRAVGFTADQLRKAWANPACAEGPCTTPGSPLVSPNAALLYWGLSIGANGTGGLGGAARPLALTSDVWRSRTVISSFWSFDRSSAVIEGFSRLGISSTGR